MSLFALLSRTDLTHLLSFLRRSFIPFSDPSGLISSMQSSNRVLLPNNGGELMLPFTTTNVVSDPLVWLRAVALNLPETCSSF